jgi:hypothetical protein
MVLRVCSVVALPPPPTFCTCMRPPTNRPNHDHGPQNDTRHPQLLSSNRETLIHEVLERDWIPRLLDWLKLSDYPAIQVQRDERDKVGCM